MAKDIEPAASEAAGAAIERDWLILPDTAEPFLPATVDLEARDADGGPLWVTPQQATGLPGITVTERTIWRWIDRYPISRLYYGRRYIFVPALRRSSCQSLSVAQPSAPIDSLVMTARPRVRIEPRIEGATLRGVHGDTGVDVPR
jgi:hypothetical protein